MIGLIYGLTNPTKDNKVFYVGQTIKSSEYRLNEHIREILYSHKKGININKNNEIFDILSKNKKPGLIVLEYVYDTKDNLNNREIYWIDYYRKLNSKLTNISDGGKFKSSLNIIRGIRRLKRLNYPLDKITEIYHMSEKEILKII